MKNLRAFSGSTKTALHASRRFDTLTIPRTSTFHYPGFEAFMLDNPAQVAVGGIEQGPASDAGVLWADVVVSVDGVSVAGKTASQLEDMLSGNEPRKMTIEIERCGKAYDERNYDLLCLSVDFRFDRLRSAAATPTCCAGWKS